MAATYPGSVTGESDPIAEADLAAHVAAADPHPQYQKESEKAQANGYASLDGGGQVPLSQLGNAPTGGGGGGADASTTVKGISKLSTAPASPTNPIAVGDNDPRNSDQRVPTDGSVTAAKVNAALKPSGSAVAGDEALRALGTGASTAAAGNDSRLSDARTPTAHAASHASAGSDPVTIAESQVTNLVTDLAAKAPLASPALTGTPTVPTATQGTNTPQAASTAYVQTETGLLVPKSLVDAKGDLLVGSADNTVIRKAVGTDGQVLTADAVSAGGVKWATPAGGAAVVGKIRVYGSAHYSPATGTNTFVDFDTEDAAVTKTGVTHTNSGTTNLTGTVQKTASSAAVVGTGTLFTTELAVGDQITIPGTANETRVVKTITDATHLTVDATFANSASGQTATRKDNTRLTVLSAGLWLISAGVWYAANNTGARFLGLYVNGVDRLDPVYHPPSPTGVQSGVSFSAPMQLAANDVVTIVAEQESSVTLGILAGSKFTWAALVRLGD